MSPRSDAKPEAAGDAFGKRISRPSRIRSFPVFRIAALWEAFLVAAASLRQNKLRTALTLVGIIVGVTAVIAVVTIIKGLDQTVASTFSSQGSTVFTISKRPRVITSREDFIKFNKRKDITEEDAEAIFHLCTNCWRAGVVANDGVTVKHGSQKADGVGVRAIAPTVMFDVDGVTVDAGRLWSETESTSAHDVCVVGPDVVANMFPNQSLEQSIGQEIWVGGRPYQIVGVLTALGKVFGVSRDNRIYIPFATYKKNFGLNVARGAFNASGVLVVFIQTPTAEQLEGAEDQSGAGRVHSVCPRRVGDREANRRSAHSFAPAEFFHARAWHPHPRAWRSGRACFRSELRDAGRCHSGHRAILRQ